MPRLIGTDEAGYGPNLGPLVVTGTLWKNDSGQECLYDALCDSIKPAAVSARDNRLLVADSKVVFKSSGSISKLEEAVLAFLVVSQIANRKVNVISAPDLVRETIPRNTEELFALVCPSSSSRPNLVAQPGFSFASVKLPVSASPESIIFRASELIRSMSDAQVSLTAVHCRPVFAAEFNQQAEIFGNKATLLSNVTMKIVAELKANYSSDDLEIVCDKHGGRNHYAGLIQNFLTRKRVTVGVESRQSSDYFFSDSDRDVAIRFQSGGESFMPTALASMISKYVREISMLGWNQYWLEKIPTIKPTKGYPVDAKRFKGEIETCQRELGIDDHQIWRIK